MYCANCGKEIPDKSRSCIYCGYDMAKISDAVFRENRDPADVYSFYPKAEMPKPGKSGNPKLIFIITAIIAGVLILAIGAFLLIKTLSQRADVAETVPATTSFWDNTAATEKTESSGSFWDQATVATTPAPASTESTGSFWDQATAPTAPAETSAHPELDTEYAKIFIDNGLILFINNFDGKPCRHFASNRLDRDGYIQNIQFAFENDVITDLVITTYYSITKEQEDFRSALVEAFRAASADIEALPFAEIAIDYPVPVSGYVTMQITYHGLDQLENVQKADLTASSLLYANEETQGLLDDGYIQLSTDKF